MRRMDENILPLFSGKTRPIKGFSQLWANRKKPNEEVWMERMEAMFLETIEDYKAKHKGDEAK